MPRLLGTFVLFPRYGQLSVKENVFCSANAFALFVKSQRKWTSPLLTQESIELFKSRLSEFNYHPDLVLPHGSYLINIGNPDKWVNIICLFL